MKSLMEIHNKQDIITILNLETDYKVEILKSSVIAIQKDMFNGKPYITYILNGNIQLGFYSDDVIID